MPFAAAPLRAPLTTILLALGWWISTAVLAAPPASVAFHYGSYPPWDELQAFDWVVVDPDHVPHPPKLELKQSEIFAYVAVGEVQPGRGYFKDIPPDWLLGVNPVWGSKVLDQAQAAWPAFLAEKIVRPLWDRGYRGFFLDTLDSYQLFAKTPQARAAQEDGMVKAILRLRADFPGIQLFFNRGFEILPRLHREVAAVAAESLFEGWDAAGKSYHPVSDDDRRWLLGRLNQVRNEYRLPVVAIDYVAPAQRELARQTAGKIRQLGFIPWVADPALEMLGVGTVEVMPRKVLVLYGGSDNEYQLTYEDPLRYGATPLNYLGYVPVYRDARKPLPDYPLAGRYAGILVWFREGETYKNDRLAEWLGRQVENGMRLAVFDDLGFALSGLGTKKLGMHLPERSGKPKSIAIVHRDALFGFDTAPLPDRRAFFPLILERGLPLLRLTADNGEIMDAAGLAPWGGYAVAPYALTSLPGGLGPRWVINPIEFLRRALALPDMPVPDVTTENGRRLLLTHIDGDGFPSRAEFPGTPFAPEVLLKQVLEKYRIPTTVSVIQGEIAANGLYPQFSAQLENLARRMFALAHVEIASHSFSHPFQWRKATEASAEEADLYNYHLDIPGYDFNLQAEVQGSIDYINRRLAPPGKQVAVFQWSGNCNPGKEALELVEKSGALSINGGETLITKRRNSLALVSPIGIWKGGHFQVYAPNQNENVYTANWTGPYYGYREALETFELTDRPYRLKPINIYYHVYSASKPAALAALEKTYRYALSQPVMPVYTSEYIRKALDFNRALVVRDGASWQLLSGGELRQWRVSPQAGIPDLAASANLAGFARHHGATYLHAAGGNARVGFGAMPARTPYLAEANARLERWRRDGANLEFTLRGHVPLHFTLAASAGCRVAIDGKPAAPARREQDKQHFELKHGTAATIQVGC